MRWLRDFRARQRQARATQLLAELMDEHGLEMAPPSDFVDWLENAPLDDSAKKLARTLAADPHFPRTGPYSSIRAYFDECLQGVPDLEMIAGQLAYAWMMENATRNRIRVQES